MKKSTPEPPPQPGRADVAEWLQARLRLMHCNQAIALVEERVAFGLDKYGTRLQTHNGRNAVEDLRQEMGDALMYAAQAAMEKRLDEESGRELLRLVYALEDLIMQGVEK